MKINHGKTDESDYLSLAQVRKLRVNSYLKKLIIMFSTGFGVVTGILVPIISTLISSYLAKK